MGLMLLAALPLISACGHGGEVESAPDDSAVVRSQDEESLPGAAQQDDQPQSAWWVDITFPPDAAHASGEGLARLNPEWSGAALLSPLDLGGRISAAELARFRNSGFRFAIEADLKPGGDTERIAAGTYEAKDGRAGRLLVIFEGSVPVWHHVAAGEAGFSALLNADGEIRWYHCMECGDYYTLRWTGSSYVLE